MSDTATDTNRDPSAGQALLVEKDLRIAALSAQVNDLTQKLEAALYRINQMSRTIFGRSSEKYDHPDQQRIDLGELTTAAPAGPVTVIPPGAKGIVSGKEICAGRAKRKPIPEGIEQILMPLRELPPEQLVLPDGRSLVQVAIKTEVRLHLIPAHFQAQHFPSAVYGLPETTEPLLCAPAVPQIIPDGLPTTDLLIHVLRSKYDLHLPLHRQAKEFSRMGVDVAKSTMCGWLSTLADFLTPVALALRSQVLASSLLYTDDIPTPMLVPGSGKTIEARFWSYCDGHQVFFEFTEDRRGCHPTQALAEYRGALMADALAQYNAIVTLNLLVRLACWAHVRRKFYEARFTDIRCQEMLLLIQKLFAADARVEDAAKAGTLVGWAVPRRKWRLRQRYSVKVLKLIEERLTAWMPGSAKGATPDSPLAKAMHYMRAQWEELTIAFDTGDWPLHNNLAENVQRMIAVGRKNHLFMGSEGGGRMAAVFYGLLQSCRLLSIDPAAYLQLVCSRLLEGGHDPSSLTPLRVLEAQLVPQLPRKR